MMVEHYQQPDFERLLYGADPADLREAIESDGYAATPYLEQLLEHPNELVRCAVVELIAHLGLAACRPQLAGALRDPSELVRADALTALFELGYPLETFQRGLAMLRRDPNDEVRATALAMQYVADAEVTALDELAAIVLDAHCDHCTQYAVLNTFACYLELDHHPGVVKLLRAVRARLDDSLTLARDIDEVLSMTDSE